jgi:predicted O-linked N-acetylglucosamine transferase (SPINDLY family)
LLDPKNAATFSNLLLAMIYDPKINQSELTQKAIEFGEIHGDPYLRARPLYNTKDPDRRLKIGYISPDFREHAVNYFFENLLTYHDRQHFEIFGYSNNQRDDHVTEQLKKKFDHWRDIRFDNDDQIADLIEQDSIDILIDLTGHTARNRLGVFARKPAPVQVTWLGYPSTTGLKAIDYRISDHYAEPNGMTEHYNVETLWRLPNMFCCYEVKRKDIPISTHPPFEKNGYITFGCFNNFARVTEPTLKAWGQILSLLPDARLLLEILGIDKPDIKEKIIARLNAHGIPTDRLILEERKKTNQFVLYNRIDIALDPFPCCGGTNSMDAVYMGVPLITLAGNHFLSRLGVTILSNINMPEFITHSVDDYIKTSIALAKNHERLKSLRHMMHQRVKDSAVYNAPQFAQDMEAAYRGMWKKYCETSDSSKALGP